MSILNFEPLSAPPSDLITHDVYLDDGTNIPSGSAQFRYYDGVSWSLLQEASYRKATMIASATVGNTVVESTLFGTLDSGDSLQFGANSLEVGQTIGISMGGVISTAGVATTIDFIVRLGATEIVSTQAVPPPTSITNVGWTLDSLLTIQATGASGTIVGTGNAICGTGTQAPRGLTNSSTPASPITIDTTNPLTLDVTVTWGTASASNTITSLVGLVKVTL